MPVVQQMADTAICFLREQGICFPASYPMPELRLSMERRTKLYGIYNKRNVLTELKRLMSSFSKEAELFEDEDGFYAAMSFMSRLELFLSGSNSAASSLKIWLQLEEEFDLLESMLSKMLRQSSNLGVRLKLWEQLVRLYAKVHQLEIKQQLSGVFSSEGRIVIYMNNIEAICMEQGLEMESYLQSVLVHEYTHACHYGDFMKQQKSCADSFSLEKSMLRWSGAYFSISKTSCVKESLARYMQAVWCRANSPQLTERLFIEAYGEYVISPNWPYAGAQVLLLAESSAGLELFHRVWQASLLDWEQAYSLLKPGT